MQGRTAIERNRRTPERIIRAGHEDFVAGIEQRTQRQVDQFAYAVTDEHLLRADAVNAATLLLHDDRFARREYALLMAVRFCLAEVLDHREPHRLGRAKTEQAGITDVQRDDLVSALLQFQSAICQLAPNLVTNVLQSFTGMYLLFHGRFQQD